MADIREKLTQFEQLLKEHVHELKSDQAEPDPNNDLAQSSDVEDDDKESRDDTNEKICVDIPVQNDTKSSDCLMLCGQILRIMGDEITCKACGKSLRNIGDEIFCNYATRNILVSLLQDLSTKTVDQSTG